MLCFGLGRLRAYGGFGTLGPEGRPGGGHAQAADHAQRHCEVRKTLGGIAPRFLTFNTVAQDVEREFFVLARDKTFALLIR